MNTVEYLINPIPVRYLQPVGTFPISEATASMTHTDVHPSLIEIVLAFIAATVKGEWR